MLDMTGKQAHLEPDDTITITDDRGYAYLPVSLQGELGITGKGSIPFIKHAGVVVLFQLDKSRLQIVNSLMALVTDKILDVGQGLHLDDWRPS